MPVILTPMIYVRAVDAISFLAQARDLYTEDITGERASSTGQKARYEPAQSLALYYQRTLHYRRHFSIELSHDVIKTCVEDN